MARIYLYSKCRQKRHLPLQVFDLVSNYAQGAISHLILLRKEVIQPQLPLRLPCYDLAPIIGFTLGAALLAVRQTTSGAPNFRGLTGGVYKPRERIHRAMLMRDY